ncbi:hypothetical protein BDR22DRAFT_780898, partial [Usnea florida]
DYTSERTDEAFARTTLDVILVDRLSTLKDDGALFRLATAAEVALSVGAKDGKDEGEIRGSADLVLTHGMRSNLRAILFIVELKRSGIAGSGLSQIMAYMAAVWDNRKGHNNNSVFGLLSDGGNFQFCFLDAKKKFFVTEQLDWTLKSPTIIAYIDRILLDAIRSSPSTTRQKERSSNTVVK